MKLSLAKIMQEISLLDAAEDIALDVHHRQKRRDNSLYIKHPKRVQGLAKSFGYPKEVQLVAILHDAIEDGYNKDMIRRWILEKLGPKILSSVEAMNHDKSIPYSDYIIDLWNNDSVAFKAKMVDMYDNLLDNPTKKQYDKYYNAINDAINIGAQIPMRLLKLLGME